MITVLIQIICRHWRFLAAGLALFLALHLAAHYPVWLLLLILIAIGQTFRKQLSPLVPSYMIGCLLQIGRLVLLVFALSFLLRLLYLAVLGRL